MSRSETSGLPSSTSSSIPKKAWGVALRSSVKNSASDIGTPSSTFLSELTEGLTRFCSMREMSPLVTPARRASSRCETPKVVRTLRSRAPTSMVMVFRILDKSREIVPPVAPFVHFIYHSQFQGQKPLLPPKPHRAAHVQRHRPHEPIRARSVLDALHRQPSVQGKAATAREGERHALLDARGASDPRCGGGTVVRERRSRPAGDRPGDPLPHTHDPARNAFSRGVPAHGAERANELERLIALHDASNIAAVIVEPIAGSTGVLIPPRGYLQRLREICDAHGILLIFDEVICGFGRTGSPFAAQEFGVTPDMITLAKGLTNGSVPMGAVRVSARVYAPFMQGREGIELSPGYTSSAHPVACAAGLATLGIYQREGLLTRAKSLAAHWEEAAHALRGAPHVIDVRNYGLILGVELEPIPGKPGTRAFDVFVKCFERGVPVRQGGDVVGLSPPLIVEPSQIDQMLSTLGAVLRGQ